MKRRPIMIMGCTSDAGKSFLVAALCRWFAQRGIKVAPFKAQNMSNNAAVTSEGLEMGRAQFMQAQAARTNATVRMNPVLLKPSADTFSQVIVNGVYDPAITQMPWMERYWGGEVEAEVAMQNVMDEIEQELEKQKA